MKPYKSNSFHESTPSGLLAFFIFVIATIITLAIGSLSENFDNQSIIAYRVNALLIAGGCLIIIRTTPKSIWYVPLICNAALIISALIEPNFWQ